MSFKICTVQSVRRTYKFNTAIKVFNLHILNTDQSSHLFSRFLKRLNGHEKDHNQNNYACYKVGFYNFII